jgi:hypothetical protein
MRSRLVWQNYNVFKWNNIYLVIRATCLENTTSPFEYFGSTFAKLLDPTSSEDDLNMKRKQQCDRRVHSYKSLMYIKKTQKN